MKFLHGHFLLALGGVVIAGLLYAGRRFYDQGNEAFLNWGDRKNVHMGLGLLLALFYIGFYLSKPAYYTAFLGGVMGDNYRYVGTIIGPCILVAHHLYFPFVPEKIFHLFVRLGLFHEGDPLFLENAFAFFSLPSRVFAFVGLWAFYRLLRRQFNVFESCVGTFFLATTFGYWFWPLQSNAVGFVIPMAVVALSITAWAFDQGTPIPFALSASAIALCIFTHISAGYMVAAMGTAVFIFGLRLIFKGDKRFVLNLSAFACAAALWIGIYYGFLRHLYGQQSLSWYMTTLSHTEDLGAFSLANFFKYLIRDGVGVNAFLLLGFVNQGGHGVLERWAILMQLGTCFFLLGSVLSDWRRVKSIFSDPAVFVATAGFLGCVMGFAMRKTWLQYCSVITGMTAFLFVSLVLAARSRAGRSQNVLALALLVLGSFYTNGLSSYSVLTERRLEDHLVYRTYSALRALTGGERSIVKAPWNSYPYNFVGITQYYSAPHGVASKTQWVQDATQKDLAKMSQQADHIFLDENAFPQGASTIPSVFMRKQMISLPDYPRISWWVRRADAPR